MNDEEQRSETELRNMPREKRPAHFLYDKCTKCGDKFKARDKVWITVEDDPVCDGCGNKIPPPPVEHKSIAQLLVEQETKTELWLIKFQEGGQWDDWLASEFSSKENLHLLLGMIVNYKSKKFEQLKQIHKLRKHLTFASRANASKRRHLRSLQETRKVRVHVHYWIPFWQVIEDFSNWWRGRKNAKAKRLSKLPAGKDQ